MNFNEYQALSQRTANEDLTPRERLANGALGLAGEAGEAADKMKKHLFQGHALDREGMRKELGDVLWYVAHLAFVLVIPLEEVAQANIDKLKERYPEGFDAVRSIERGGCVMEEVDPKIIAKIARNLTFRMEAILEDMARNKADLIIWGDGGCQVGSQWGESGTSSTLKGLRRRGLLAPEHKNADCIVASAFAGLSPLGLAVAKYKGWIEEDV